jgi:DNA-binding GntR family transcriptional regulator
MVANALAAGRKSVGPGAPGAATRPLRSNRVNLADLAYDRCEELIVSCALSPGMSLSLQDLQAATGVGRTPIHQAVSRLAADTLIIVRPRHGLQIAPIDLTRERVLLRLRRDLERFALRLAAERCGASERNQLLHISRVLRDPAGRMDVHAFNRLDRHIDQLLSAAAGEKLLEHTLRPLHTIFRRIGLIYHTWVAPQAGLDRTVACHIDILDAVISRDPDRAARSSDDLIDFVAGMIDAMEHGVDPSLLDCTLAQLG